MKNEKPLQLIIRKIGNSRGIILPADFVKRNNLEDGIIHAIENNDGTLMLYPSIFSQIVNKIKDNIENPEEDEYEDFPFKDLELEFDIQRHTERIFFKNKNGKKIERLPSGEKILLNIDTITLWGYKLMLKEDIFKIFKEEFEKAEDLLEFRDSDNCYYRIAENYLYDELCSTIKETSQTIIERVWEKMKFTIYNGFKEPSDWNTQKIRQELSERIDEYIEKIENFVKAI